VLARRYLILVNWMKGARQHRLRMMHVSRTTVYRVAWRFREYGEAGLIDRREENGNPKVNEAYLAVLYDVVVPTPMNTAGNGRHDAGKC